jgi:predicted dehydrogenase
VIVATPHYIHPDLTMDAMKCGLHVMSEKPAGVYTKQVRELIEFTKTSDKTYAIMFNQRTNCVYRKLKELIDGGALGEMKRVTWLITDWYRPQCYYDSGAWRATWAGEGGGVLLNQCPHQLDLWQWILGMPKKVQSFMRYGQWHDIEVEDDVTTYMEYEDGHTGVFITSTGDPHGSNRFEVQMDGAQLVCENDRLYLAELEQLEQDWTKTNTQPFGSVPGKEIVVETDGLNPQHQGVFEAFAAAILRGEPLIAGGEEGLRGLTLSNAMHLSAFLGRPVEIPFDEHLYYEELMKRVASSRRKAPAKAVFAGTEGTY